MRTLFIQTLTSIASERQSLDPFVAAPLYAKDPSLQDTEALFPSNDNEIKLFQMGLPKNLSIYWSISTVLAFWFLFIHAPPLLIKRDAIRDAPFMLHLFGAYSVYLGCVFNALLTPSTIGGKARPWHIGVGRFAMIGGLFGIVFGYWKSWIPFGATPMSFAIPISIGGIAQLIAQIVGYKSIKEFQRLKSQIEEMEASGIDSSVELDDLKVEKEKALKGHIFAMIVLFAAACGVPGAVRVAELFGKMQLILLIVFNVSLQAMSNPFALSYLKRSANPEETPLKGDTGKAAMTVA